MALLAVSQPFSLELTTARFRAFGLDRATAWEDGALYRAVGGREVRIAAGDGSAVEVDPLDAETADRDEPCLHFFIWKQGQSREIDLRAREADDVLRLPAREAERDEFVRGRECDPLAARERPHATDRLAQPLDEPAPDRDCGEEGDLLGGDRRDERLERVGRERRTEAGETDDEWSELLLGGRPRSEGDEVEVEAE
ncbi:MAG TPA: hypothetical protein VE261_04040, partial [Gaiellaceae bacterium]|nr:hypothetical protein [Gaiellaceae bacterium]